MESINNLLDGRVGKEAFQALVAERGNIEAGWRQFAGITIPYLFRTEGDSETVSRQSFLTKGVNSLANRITEVLLPVSRPPFTLEPNATQLETGDAEQVDDLRRQLATIAGRATEVMSEGKYTAAAIDLITKLIVLGSAVYKTDGKEIVTLNHTEYALSKDINGDLQRFIWREFMPLDSIDHSDLSTREALIIRAQNTTGYVALYTDYVLKGKKWTSTQYIEESTEALNVSVMGLKAMPWKAIDWIKVRGESYGVGLIESQIHTCVMYNELQGALDAAILKSADFRVLIDPASSIDPESFNQGLSGDSLAGKKDEVSVVANGLGAAEIQRISEYVDSLKRELSAVFLMQGGITRDAERVTAEEIRQQSNALEQAYGAVFIGLSQSIQRPFIEGAIKEAGLDKIDAEIVLKTGSESLSRYSELNNIRAFINDLGMAAQAIQAFPNDINTRELVNELISNNAAPINVLNSLKDANAAKEAEAQAQAAAQAPQGPVGPIA